jgi:hypothetical protein
MFRNSIAKVTLFLCLWQLVFPKCLLLTQLDGLCTACPSSLILLSGYCVTPMQGCQLQISQNVCGTCASGYKLTNNFCAPLTSSQAGTGGKVAQYL